jgi:hypothetical protein
MEPKKKPAKRKPLGALPEQNDDDLDALSAISPADLVRAQQLWQQNAPGPLKSLLKAQVEEK